MRKKERTRFPIRPGSKDAPLFFECLDFNAIRRKINAYLADFLARSSGKAFTHDHEGIEFIHVLSGKVDGHAQLSSLRLASVCLSLVKT